MRARSALFVAAVAGACLGVTPTAFAAGFGADPPPIDHGDCADSGGQYVQNLDPDKDTGVPEYKGVCKYSNGYQTPALGYNSNPKTYKQYQDNQNLAKIERQKEYESELGSEEEARHAARADKIGRAPY